jgi:uncharacterized RDD family membrane protein YckC
VTGQAVDSTARSSAVEEADEAAGLARRLGAIFYDALLLFAVVLVTTAALMLATGSPIDPGTPLHRALLIVVSYVYFGFAWTRSGQTLGMKTWRIRVRTFDDRPLTWGRAALRFTTAALSWAALGLGFAWMLVDRQSMTWHDRLSRTVLVKVPRA